jgi:hypothetical protein
MHVRVRFHLGAWSDGIIRDRLLHMDGYTFTKGMVTAFGWEVWTYPVTPLDVGIKGDSVL